MSGALRAAAPWIGVAGGGVVTLVVAGLLGRVLRPVREIERYAVQVLDGSLGIARNVDGVDEAVRTRELAQAVPPLALGYLRRRGLVP